MAARSSKIVPLLLTFLLGLLLSAPAARADVTMTLTGVNNGFTQGNVYVDPYTATITGLGANILVLCDDYTAETSIGQTWSVNVSTVSNLQGQEKFQNISDPFAPQFWNQQQNTQQEYDAAASLAIQLMQPANMNVKANAIDYSYAIWSIFDPSSLNDITDPTDKLKIQNLTENALLATYSPGEFANVQVYTATTCSQGVCTPSNTPQEFLVITPEASAPVTLAVYLLGLLGVIFVIRRHTPGVFN